jgi:programmed cell death protein 5
MNLHTPLEVLQKRSTLVYPSIDGSDGVASMSSNVDDELAAIRAKRMSEIQGQLEEQAAAQADAEIKQQVAQAEELELDNAMKTILTSEARGRLARLQLVNSELTKQVKTHLLNLSSQNKIQTPVTDQQIKKILSGLSENKREVSIRRI